MNNDDLLEQILQTPQEKQIWQNINAKLEEQLKKIQEENISKLADAIPPSGTKYLNDPIHPKHVTTAPRELVIHIEAELSTINDKQQLEDIALVFNHYYHIAIPPDTDYREEVSKFMIAFDQSVKDFAPRISPPPISTPE